MNKQCIGVTALEYELTGVLEVRDDVNYIVKGSIKYPVKKESLREYTGFKSYLGEKICVNDKVRIYGGESYYGTYELDVTGQVVLKNSINPMNEKETNYCVVDDRTGTDYVIDYLLDTIAEGIEKF